jgi:hypothetical protein
VFAFRVVEHLDVVEHVPSGVVAALIGAPPDPFPFQELEETLCDGIVVAVLDSSHQCDVLSFVFKAVP